MSKAKRYVALHRNGREALIVAWEYREADESDKHLPKWIKESDYASLQAEHDRLRKIVEREDGEMVYYKDYAKLQAENERLKNAGDAFIGTYLFATAKGLVNQDTAVKVVEEWVAAKTGKTP